MADIQNISHLVSAAPPDISRGQPLRAPHPDAGNADPNDQVKISAQPNASPDQAANSGQSVESAVVRLQDYAQRHQRNLEFKVDEGTGQIVVRVVDPETDRVVREIPPEEMLALARFLQEQSDEGGGALLRTKA